MTRLTRAIVIALVGLTGCRAGLGASPSLSSSPSLTESASAAATATFTASPSPSPSPTPTSSPSPSPVAWTGTIPTEPTGPELAGERVSAEDRDESFVVTLTISQERYRAGQLIEGSAALEFLGPGSEAVMLGSTYGFFGFGVKSSDPPVIVYPGSTTDCRPHPISKGVPQVFPLAKSGGASQDDPADAFARAYLATPEFRLPAGTWTIFTFTGFFTGADCGDELHELSAEVTITVEP